MSNVVECGSELVYFGSRRNILTPRIRIRVVYYLNINTLKQNLKSKSAKKVFKPLQKKQVSLSLCAFFGQINGQLRILIGSGSYPAHETHQKPPVLNRETVRNVP